MKLRTKFLYGSYEAPQQCACIIASVLHSHLAYGLAGWSAAFRIEGDRYIGAEILSAYSCSPQTSSKSTEVGSIYSDLFPEKRKRKRKKGLFRSRVLRSDR